MSSCWNVFIYKRVFWSTYRHSSNITICKCINEGDSGMTHSIQFLTECVHGYQWILGWYSNYCPLLTTSSLFDADLKRGLLIEVLDEWSSSNYSTLFESPCFPFLYNTKWPQNVKTIQRWCLWSEAVSKDPTPPVCAVSTWNYVMSLRHILCGLSIIRYYYDLQQKKTRMIGSGCKFVTFFTEIC